MICVDLLKISSNQVVNCADNTSDIGNSVCLNDNEEVDSGITVSPGGHKYYVPFCVEDKLKPFMNKSFENMESGIAFYKVYANLCGFSVRCSAEKFVMCGLLCRHALCALNHFEVVKIPRCLVLNRWMKNAENASSQMFAVSNEIQSMDLLSAELTSLWFRFHKCVIKAGSDLLKLKFIGKTIKDLHSVLGDDGDVFSKKDFMGSMIGKQPVREITIHPPVKCKNKGSGLKRLVSEKETTIIKAKKKKRQCKLCKPIVHDQRTCPDKNQVVAVGAGHAPEVVAVWSRT